MRNAELLSFDILALQLVDNRLDCGRAPGDHHTLRAIQRGKRNLVGKGSERAAPWLHHSHHRTSCGKACIAAAATSESIFQREDPSHAGCHHCPRCAPSPHRGQCPRTSKLSNVCSEQKERGLGVEV